MTAHIAQKKPYAVEVEAGKTYYWCSCGLSTKQPYCDGSHKPTEFVPMAFTADATETTFLCGCKATQNPPFCDSTHGLL